MSVTREKLEEIFKVYDDKRNGAIRTEEIGKLIRSARLFPSQEDISELRSKVDPRRTGNFNMQTFIDVAMNFAASQAHIKHDEELMKAFSFFDQDESGYIQESELRKIMSSFAEPLSEEQIKDIMKYARARDGKINYRDFIRTILTGKLE